MSLENPDKLEKFIGWAKAFGHWRYVMYAVLGLVVLGAVLFGIDRFTNWRENRASERAKQAVNAALANAVKIETQINVLKGRQEEQLQQANAATHEYLDAVNATNEVRVETNKALANIAEAKNTNTVGVTVSELEEKLRKLDQ